ncbi:hypothetical protein CYFUS_003655 [Cystobacter fuscus]|uniref:Uncharacterized protein n=1 Tax=Cystobacter fuscus TaxID=43 RepID=A0A250J3Y3_9BACT|nr:putative metal-binding motif-containing protein [Cystobacter fuscus]ATB38222.1 hypothetical protein CYFUS_003655 [Cystobacter fuscus]
MNRVVPALLLVLWGCGGERVALQALIQVDPQVLASCIALDVIRVDGTVLQTQKLARPLDRQELRVAIFQGALPQDIQLQARALWGAACEEPLLANGWSAPVTARFEPTVGAVSLRLGLPPPSLDADRDGFVSQTEGGPDCDDSRPQSRPGVQELCDGSADLNCDGLWGCDDSTCSRRACSRTASALVFTTPERQTLAGECSPRPVVVERRDVLGEPAVPNHAIALQLSASSSLEATFYADAACRSPLVPTIPARASSLSFYVRGTRATSGLLTASSELGEASLAHTVLPGTPTKLAFSAASDSSLAGECVPLTLERRDAYDNAAPGPRRTVSFSPAPSAQLALYSDAACGTRLSSATFPEGAVSLPLYFRGTRAGEASIVASTTGSADARYTRRVNAGPASKLSLGLPGQTVLAGSCSPQATVRTLDAFDNPTGPSSEVPVDLSATVGMGLSFHADAGCTTGLSTLTLSARVPSGSFYFKGRTGGSVDVTAATAGMTPVTRSQRVAPVVRRGTCTLSDRATSVTCPIDPSLGSRERSFLVFQATTNNERTDHSFVRCRLVSTSTLTCDRVGSQGIAHIQWQVVERSRGLRVQHLEQSCPNNNQELLTVNIPTSVRMESSFVLFSSSQAGSTTNANDFATVRLTSPQQVEIALEENCNGANYAVQVVELEGLSVSRGLTGATDAASVEAPVPPAEASRSVLTSTFRAEGNDDVICNRMVRGEIVDREVLRFSRGAGSTSCDSTRISGIAYERLTFPEGYGVQARNVSLDNNALSTTETLSDVDPTRTLLLSSSQVHGGQGAGETSYRGNDVPGAGTARFWLTSPTRLEVARDAPLDSARWTVYAVQFEP